MNPKYKMAKHHEVVDLIIQALASNNITYDEAPSVLENVKFELDQLCKQQVIQIP